MVKALSLNVVSGNKAPEARPLISAVPASAPAKAEERGGGIQDLVRDVRHAVIESYGSDSTIPEAVEGLAVRMMNSSGLISGLLPELRQHYIQGQKEFHLSLAGRSETEKRQIIALFQDMAGLVSNIRYASGSSTLSGSLALLPRAQNFLTGQYLELAVYKTIRDVLTELADRYKADFEIYRNVKVADRKGGNLKNEFDVVIRFNGVWYIVECKSGKNYSDWDGFLSLGTNYNVMPAHMLLVDPCISGSRAEIIEYFCGYHVCSLTADTLREKVTEMIGHDMAA